MPRVLPCRLLLLEPRLWSLLLIGIAGLGCGGGGDKVATQRVTGTVNFSGQPISEGEIRLIAEGDTRTDAGKIENGKFQLSSTPGKKRVEIYAVQDDPNNRIESAVEPGKFEPATKMYIPAKYNVKSELETEVQASGGTTLELNLEA